MEEKALNPAVDAAHSLVAGRVVHPWRVALAG